MYSNSSKTTMAGTGALGLILLALALPAQAQRGSTPPECEEIVRAADEGQTLDDIRTRIERTRPTQPTLQRCLPVIAENPKVATLLRQQEQAVQRQLQTRNAQITTSAKRFEQISANQRVIRARNEGTTRMQSIAAQPPAAVPLPDQQASPPAISNVTPSPVVPGANIVIEGTGLGTSGTVRLLLDGKIFNAAINQWSSGWISAFLSADISGVSETQGAVIEVRPQGATAISRAVSFVPVYESKILQTHANHTDLSAATAVLAALGFPGEGYVHVYQQTMLQNSWRVASGPSANVQNFLAGLECSIAGPPAATTGATNLSTRLYMAWGLLQNPGCTFTIEIEGPRGLDPGI